MTYTRENFRVWLHSLTPDAPFCRYCNCPITEFMITKLGRDSFDNVAAESLDIELAAEIDEFCQHPKYRADMWALLTAREAISIIDEVEARAT